MKVGLITKFTVNGERLPLLILRNRITYSFCTWCSQVLINRHLDGICCSPSNQFVYSFSYAETVVGGQFWRLYLHHGFTPCLLPPRSVSLSPLGQGCPGCPGCGGRGSWNKGSNSLPAFPLYRLLKKSPTYCQGAITKVSHIHIKSHFFVSLPSNILSIPFEALDTLKKFQCVCFKLPSKILQYFSWL